jgi:hypothetical protein
MSQKNNKQKELEKEYIADKKMVRGIFNFHEVRGGKMSFVYKKYRQEPIKKYDLVDGQMYTIPLGVAKHLNKNGWYPVHAFTMDAKEKPSMKIGKKVRRFGFQGLDFGVSEDFSDGYNIVTAESIG